jgi:ribosomal-protein-alanine N-acetyltransferase
MQVPQPVLTADELTLRPWDSADSPVLYAAYRDPDIQHWHVRTMTETEARERVASWSQRWVDGTGADWAVIRDGQVAARMGFRQINRDEQFGEVAYWTLPHARGRNIASRALRVMSAWMLSEGGLHRLELNHSIANLGSCRVAEKAGFVAEGTRRQETRHADGWHDMHMHSRLADD